MRVRVQSQQGKTVAQWVLEVLRIALIVVGISSLSIFAWLQFERFYFEAQYLKEFDRLAAAARQPRKSERSIQPSSPPLPASSMQEPTPSEDAQVNSLSGAEMRVLARLRVPRIGLSVAVLQGIEDHVLRRGAGWIPGTARPGEPGNVGIAAHRDTFFRPLREIRSGDRVELETPDAGRSYVVRSVSVVEPEFTGSLQPTNEPTVTLVTCFPFGYAGPAPRRYIVQAVADKADPPPLAAGVEIDQHLR